MKYQNVKRIIAGFLAFVMTMSLDSGALIYAYQDYLYQEMTNPSDVSIDISLTNSKSKNNSEETVAITEEVVNPTPSLTGNIEESINNNDNNNTPEEPTNNTSSKPSNGEETEKTEESTDKENVSNESIIP